MIQVSLQEYDKHLGGREAVLRRNEHLLFPLSCISCRHSGADLKIVTLHIIRRQKKLEGRCESSSVVYALLVKNKC